MLCYTPIDRIDIDKILTDIENTLAREVIIFNETEWELRIITKSFVDRLKEKNVKLTIVFGSFFDEYYERYADSKGISLDNLIFWPTFWITWTEMCLKWVIDYKSHTVNTDFKYPFISLNNKNHRHREALIDHLAKYNLLDKGIVTWHKFMDYRLGHHDDKYEFKHYDNSTRTIDDNFATQLDSFLIPKQWNECFLHVVGEATTSVQIISEKTIIPVLMKKPFVCIAKKGYSKRLVELGFKLYDEIIDYSFDECDDLSDRADKLCYSVSQLGTNYSELYELLRPKIEFNYQRCLEIIHDGNLVPDIIKDNLKKQDPNFVALATYGRYLNICNDCCHD